MFVQMFGEKISLIPWQNMKSMNCQKQTARPFIIIVIMLLPLVLLVLSIAFFDNKFQCVLIKHLIALLPHNIWNNPLVLMNSNIEKRGKRSMIRAYMNHAIALLPSLF